MQLGSTVNAFVGGWSTPVPDEPLAPALPAPAAPAAPGAPAPAGALPALPALSPAWLVPAAWPCAPPAVWLAPAAPLEPVLGAPELPVPAALVAPAAAPLPVIGVGSPPAPAQAVANNKASNEAEVPICVRAFMAANGECPRTIRVSSSSREIAGSRAHSPRNGKVQVACRRASHIGRGGRKRSSALSACWLRAPRLRRRRPRVGWRLRPPGPSPRCRSRPSWSARAPRASASVDQRYSGS